MVRVIYFNQWFSSITDVINDIKKKHGNSIKIIASSKNKDHVYKTAVDKFIPEDWDDECSNDEALENYLEFVARVCRDYKVDLFFLKKNASYIMDNHIKFMGLTNGMTRLISENYDTLKLLSEKSLVYDKLSQSSLKNIVPNYYNFDNLGDAFKLLMEHNNKNDLCLKLNSGEGGTSFRAINDEALNKESLYNFRVNTIKTSEAIQLLFSVGDDIKDLLFMDLLDSPEISVDCYKSKQGFIAICRAKEEGRKQKIFYNKKIYDICNSIQQEFKIQYPFNVQFRLKHGGKITKSNDLRLLEINPRLSGGIYYETLAGFNLAEICMLDMLNRTDEYNIDDFIRFNKIYVTHVEKAIKL